MIQLTERYVFHIPLYKYAGDELVRIELDNLLDNLINEFSESGFENFYLTKAKAHYKTRCFDELLLTIFTLSGSPVEVFERWFRNGNDVLGQEAFAWECGNSLYISELM